MIESSEPEVAVNYPGIFYMQSAYDNHNGN